MTLNIATIPLSCRVTLHPALAPTTFTAVMNTSFSGTALATDTVTFMVTAPHFMNTPYNSKVFYENQWLGKSENFILPFRYSGDIKLTASVLGAADFVLTLSSTAPVMFNSSNV